MAHPDQVLVRLNSISGNSCGVLEETCDKIEEDGNNVRYDRQDNVPFRICEIRSIIDGSGDIVDWELKIMYLVGGNCFGLHVFRLDDPETDPPVWGGYTKIGGGGVASVAPL